MTRTVVVTGGCGFIGSHLVRMILSRYPDWRVVNLDNLTYAGDPQNVGDVSQHQSYSLVEGDISDRALVDGLFQRERPWAIINCAAETHVDRSMILS